jgi:peroxiredoxin
VSTKHKKRRTPARPQPKTQAPPAAGARSLWIVTALVFLVLIGVTGALWMANRPGEGPPPATTSGLGDASASPSLVKAADQVGFHTVSEPGVGEVEGDAADAGDAQSNPDLLTPGTQAPAFSLQTPTGDTVSLDSLRGKAVLLEFFATWCPHCQAEAPHLAKLARELKPEGVEFVSVNADSETAPSVFAYHRYFGLPFPSLLDPGQPAGSFTQQGGRGPVSTAYKVGAYPTFYVIDPQGKVVWADDGEQPDAMLRDLLLKTANG